MDGGWLDKIPFETSRKPDLVDVKRREEIEQRERKTNHRLCWLCQPLCDVRFKDLFVLPTLNFIPVGEKKVGARLRWACFHRGEMKTVSIFGLNWTVWRIAFRVLNIRQDFQAPPVISWQLDCNYIKARRISLLSRHENFAGTRVLLAKRRMKNCLFFFMKYVLFTISTDCRDWINSRPSAGSSPLYCGCLVRERHDKNI